MRSNIFFFFSVCYFKNMSVPSQTSLGSPTLPSQSEIDKIVSNYFIRKGYSVSTLQQENTTLDQLLQQFKSNNQTQATLKSICADVEDIETIQSSYESLREWVIYGLDIYKTELRELLYPMFMYTFLEFVSRDKDEYAKNFLHTFKHDHLQKHNADLKSLESTKSYPDKYTVKISRIPLEIFLRFLQENKYRTLIRIVNECLHIEKIAPISAGGGSDKGEMNIKTEDDMDLDKPLTAYTSTDIQAELESLHELRRLVSLGSVAPPSVCLYTFHHTQDQINCFSISEDANLIAGGFSESFIKIWNLKGEKLQSQKDKEKGSSGTEYKKLIGHSGPIYGLSFSHDNKYLISCSEDKTVRLWCLETFKNLVCYKNHNYPVWDVDFGPHGFYFATASHDKTARLWSCDYIYPLRIFSGHLSDVNTVRFHPNSKYIVTGSCDRTARLWDVQRGTCVRVFTGHKGSIHTVAISPNGRLMASAGEDMSIILWDLGSGKRLKTMTGHTGFIYSVAFNPDSTIVVSGSADGTVRIWDVNKNTPNEFKEVQTQDYKRAKLNGKGKDKKEKMKPLMIDINTKRTKKNSIESDDHLAAFPTKSTPIYAVQFTKRNLCLAAGAKLPSA
ncbi:WD40-repeat-containing domain protein [Sporodiniella umbellata]|nr:WD40-repeat-containing domain protein [Sporodiniella umbellata]